MKELVSGVRSLESRFKALEESVNNDSARRMRPRRFRRFHPMMFHEMSHMIGGKPGDPIGLLIFASMLKDDAPWLYELGVEAYHIAKRGKTPEAQHAIRRFRKVAEFSLHGPFAEETGGPSKRAAHDASRTGRVPDDR
jgi:hypothetical protein